MTRGAPLRFVGGVLAGWTGLRVVMLWPDALPAPVLDAAPVAAATTEGSPDAPAPSARLAFFASPAHPLTAEAVRGAEPQASRLSPPIGPGEPLAVSSPPQVAAGTSPPPQIATVVQAPARPYGPTPVLLPRRPRLAVDSWLVLRPGGGESLAFGQLGASQGGARLTHALDEGRQVALSARLSAPVRGPAAELGIGVDVRPTSLPVHLLAEARADRNGVRPAAGAIAGLSAPLPAGARADIYVQGGAVWRRGGFVDGAAQLARPVWESGAGRIELGGGAWGAAQRRVSRLDVGPSAALVAPIGGKAVRLQLDYRVRVAGRARPGSGPALTLGGSF